MKNPKILSDETLLITTKNLAAEEREITLNILRHLRELERRQLYASLGYSSLFAYAVEELRYSESAAQRRISSMRLLRDLPEIEEKVEDGTLSLTSLAKAQHFFRQEEIRAPEVKKELLLKIEGKSTREVERVLVQESSAPEKLFPEKVRPVGEDLHHLSFTVTREEMEQMEELRALLSHRMPGMTLKELLQLTVAESLEKHRIKKPKAVKGTKTKGERAAPQVQTRHIPAEIEREVWHRDGGVCTFVDEVTGRPCKSRHFLQLDHIKPYAKGGTHTVDNLRLRCAAHNRLSAVLVFGRSKMAAYIAAMR